ncbi:MFS transporter [Paucisalibacillus globulus]|uniref:MFS transporter n=1 Tax=Paucisalibacillus globulus TaxID=351095 RepID=UPI000BB6A63C|nr:MFS transporter [Paucisalibacillus globulus]
MKSKSFRFLWIGDSFANLGDVLYIVGLITILYEITSSAFYLALLPFFNTFGRFIGSTLAPLLFDKYRLKTILVGSQLNKTFILFVLCCLITFTKSHSLWLILFMILIIAFLDGWSMPASMSLLPRLVQKDEIVQANSFVAVIDQTIQLGAWAVGGVLVVLLGGQNVVWLTFTLFVCSTCLLHRINDDTPIKTKDAETTKLQAMKEGWILIWKKPLYRLIHLLISFEAIANVVWIAAILYVFVTEILQKSEAWWGYINTAFFIGMILGGIACSRYAKHIEKHLRLTMLITSALVSVIAFSFGFNPIAWISLLLVAFNGVVQQVKGITIEVYLQREATPYELPKIYGAQSALISLMFGVSTLAFGAIADFLSVQIAFLVSGTLLAIGAGYVYFYRGVFPKGYFGHQK